jgi:hypothetical protein
MPMSSGVGKASGKEWKAMDFVLTYSDGFAERAVLFTAFGEVADKIAIMPDEAPAVSVRFAIDASKYGDRWYNSVKALDVQLVL